LAVNGTPQQPLEPRMTEVSKISQLKQEINSAKDKKDYSDDDCPPPRRCGGAPGPHDSSDPNSPGWVHANEVAMGQLPDDVKAKLPKWIPARTVPFLPEPASTGEAGGPCCVCPQCGLSSYTPNDYWGHLPSCPVPGPKPCVQTVLCGINSHFDSDPRVCMCRNGPAPSSTAIVVASLDSSSSSGP